MFQWRSSTRDQPPATRHRISRARRRYVVENFQVEIDQTREGDAPKRRLLYLGNDEDGVTLEVAVFQLEDDSLLVIHAMRIRERYRHHLEG